MALPYDILMHIGSFLEEDPKTLMSLGCANKHMYAFAKTNFVTFYKPEMFKHVLKKMVQHVLAYPSYKIEYKFLYQWHVNGCKDKFALVIQKNGKRIIGCLSKDNFKIHFTSLQELLHIAMDNVFPLLDEIEFKSGHEYKRKQVNLIDFDLINYI